MRSVHRPMTVHRSLTRPPSDGASGEYRRSRSHDQVGHDREERPPSDESLPLSRCITAVHASGWRLRSQSMTDEQRWRSDDSEPSTCRQVRPLISFTYSFIRARALYGDRVDSVSTISTHFKWCPWIRRLLSRPVSYTGKKRVGHSPTRRKIWRKSSLNCGAV